MSIVDSLVKGLSAEAILVGKRQLMESAFQKTFQGVAPATLRYRPGEYQRIFLRMNRDTSMLDIMHPYLEWRYVLAACQLNLAVCTHAKGVGFRWAQEVAIGESGFFTGPTGKFMLDALGDYYGLVGDISAIANHYQLKRHLPPAIPVYSLVYAERKADYFPDVRGGSPFAFHELPFNPTTSLIEPLSPLVRERPGKGILYVGAIAGSA